MPRVIALCFSGVSSLLLCLLEYHHHHQPVGLFIGSRNSGAGARSPVPETPAPLPGLWWPVLGGAFGFPMGFVLGFLKLSFDFPAAFL